jgi:vacuolar-type H+-ATPase subunit F/Vma7
MGLCAFIGDEVTAAGFRLAGIDVHTPAPQQTPRLFQRLLGEAEFLLITVEAAARLPEEALRRAIVTERPLVLVIPDVRGHGEPPDIAAALRRQLGMAE